MKGRSFVCVILLFTSRSLAQLKKPTISSLHVTSDIKYRFATTRINSVIANGETTAQEAVFSVTLPKTAFISNFSMTIDGKDYAGVVKEKEAALRLYKKAKSKGITAGHVAVKPRETSQFKVSVNVAAQRIVHFNVTYQELLQRRLGQYHHSINVNPGQIVNDFKIEIFINESKKINNLTASLNPSNGISSPRGKVSQINVMDNTAVIKFSPTISDQQALSKEGISGQFEVKYDVERGLNAGEIQVVNGYFVHYFAPNGLKTINKNVMFILDVSSSMSGRKIAQTKDAMKVILNDLREGDNFNMIKFSSNVHFWNKTDMVPFNPTNLKRGLQFIEDMRTIWATNINEALVKAIQFLKNLEAKVSNKKKTSIIIFLTDGQASAGVTNEATILKNVKQENGGGERYTLFNLAFGKGADFNFLKQMSLQNGGLARKIYEDSDAALQLQGFYKEVANPLLSNIRIKYLNDAVENSSLTTNEYDTYFDGSEIVVAGKLSNNAIKTFQTKVEANAATGPLTLTYGLPLAAVTTQPSPKDPSVKELTSFTERLWAYLTIKNLLDQMVETTNPTEKVNLKKKALDLSLKYHFVTPVTSMVVLKPDDPTKDAANPNPDYGHTSTSRRTYNRGSSSSSASADNDPHIIIDVKGSKKPICFDLVGKENEVYRLLSDHQNGITVNAKILDTKTRNKKSGERKTYFRDISIMVHSLQILASYEVVFLNRERIDWTSNKKYQMGSATLMMENDRLTVKLGEGISFVVMRHKRYWRKKNDVTLYVGFYLINGNGLSRGSHGLIGQFQHKKVHAKTTNILRHSQPTAKLYFMKTSHPLWVQQVQFKNMLKKDYTQCWFIPKYGRGAIDGKISDYRVKTLMWRRSLIM